MVAMSGYTIANLKEVEDRAPKFGLSPDLEARFARVALDAEMIGITYQRLAPNVRIPWGHTHKTQERMYLVVTGSLRFKVEDETHDLGPWDVIRDHKDTMRGMRQAPTAPSSSRSARRAGPATRSPFQDWWRATDACDQTLGVRLLLRVEMPRDGPRVRRADSARVVGEALAAQRLQSSP
jgi:quercetin dioxygenase-like cupin family protein